MSGFLIHEAREREREMLCDARFGNKRQTHTHILGDSSALSAGGGTVPHFILSDRLENSAIAFAHPFLRLFLPWAFIPEFDGCVCVRLCLWEDTPSKRDVMYVPNLIGVQPAGT